MPLDPDTKPIRLHRFDGLDDAVRRHGTDTQVAAYFADRLMVGTVDDNLTAAINFFNARIGLQQYGMAVGTATRWVRMRHGAGDVRGDVQEQGAATDHVQLLHAKADGQDRHL